ncbi:MAG TPA: hypothetical protein VMU78_05875 [Methylocella sp.]|nr:hypothetical protein [Methylocella sp.]
MFRKRDAATDRTFARNALTLAALNRIENVPADEETADLCETLIA